MVYLVEDKILLSITKNLLKVTNNFISLCQSRVLRIPAVSLIQKDEIVMKSLFRWDNPVVYLKLSNGNQRNCPWQHLWWVPVNWLVMVYNSGRENLFPTWVGPLSWYFYVSAKHALKYFLEIPLNHFEAQRNLLLSIQN